MERDELEPCLSPAPRAGRAGRAGCAWRLLALLGCCAAGAWRAWRPREVTLQGLQEKQEVPVAVPTQGGTLEPGPGCPNACGGFVACALNVSSVNNLLPLEVFEREGWFPFNPQISPTISLQRLFNKQITPFAAEFQCPNTECFIPRAFLDDDFCDCPGSCADESGHDCLSCGAEFVFAGESFSCPRVCGALNANEVTCLGLGSGEAFLCPNSTCQISRFLLNDGRCDCVDCADEELWSCENCTCPSICGVSIFPCDESGVFVCPSFGENFSCNLPGSRENDGVCDCPETCDDEDGTAVEGGWMGAFFLANCDFCRCPNACGQDISPLGNCRTEFDFLNFVPFVCPGGCEIPNYYQDDDICDCPGTCADESSWTCETCGCPDQCGGFSSACTEPFFQCPESNCTVPIIFVNDNYCDCPNTCADEEFWTCETCTFGCGTKCGSSYPCDLRIFQCQIPSPVPIPGRDPPDLAPCEILGVQVNDNVCDCPLCEDEDLWTCESCLSGCPQSCGDREGNEELVCGVAPNFQMGCPGGAGEKACFVNSTSYLDGTCDCVDCLDEVNYVLALDSGCEEICEVLSVVPELKRDYCPESCGKEVKPCTFSCGDAQGCVIRGFQVNDGQCDCGNCADEDAWSCSNCTCVDSCPWEGQHPEPLCEEQFFCDDGCVIEAERREDGRCDCPSCEDETAWNCTSCFCTPVCAPQYAKLLPLCEDQFRCPDGCLLTKGQVGDLTCDCPGSCADESSHGLTCEECTCPLSCGQPVPPCRFECPDGCLLPSSLQNDFFCDCPNSCADEGSNFQCTTNGGLCICASGCEAEDAEVCGAPPPPAPPGLFACPDGCLILDSYREDNYCDCSDCSDEVLTRWDCLNCGCPSDCGDFVYCGFAVPAAPPVPPPAASGRRLSLPSAEWMQQRKQQSSAHWAALGQPPRPLAVPATPAPLALERAEPEKPEKPAKLEPPAEAQAESTGPLLAPREPQIQMALGSEGLQEALARAAELIRGALRAARRQEGDDRLEVLRGLLRSAWRQDPLGPALTPAARREALRLAARGAFDGKALERLARALEEGGKAEERGKPKMRLGEEPLEPVDEARRPKTQKQRGAFDAVEFIVQELIHLAYTDRRSLQDLLSPGRRLQGRPDIPSVLIPEDAFQCPNDPECALPRYFQNNRKCDCPDTCADEDAFDCTTCVPQVPFGAVAAAATDASLGAAVGVSLGVAIGVSLGVGLGLSSALGAFVAAGVVQLQVPNVQEFIEDPQVQQGMKQAFLRLARLTVAEAAVNLNWACAAEALSQLGRSLTQALRLCFEIEVQGEQQSLDVCEVLAGTSRQGAESVIREELLRAGAGQSCDLVAWRPEANPRASNPVRQRAQSPNGPFMAPAQGVDFG